MLNGLPSIPSPEALTLRTERLALLPINRAHAPAMFDVLRDESLYAFTGGSPPADVETLARLYEFWEQRRSPDGTELWFNWAVQLRAQGEFVGHLQASVQPDHADMAWVLGAKWQRAGYATEAATAVLAWLLDLGVRAIRASIHPDHAASIRVAERLGFQRTTESSDMELIWQRV